LAARLQLLRTTSVRKKGRIRKCQGNQKEEIPGQDQEQDKASKAGASSQGRTKKEINCFNCKGDHYISNCPELIALCKAKEEGKITAAMREGSTFC
jgi:hypothetical protein